MVHSTDSKSEDGITGRLSASQSSSLTSGALLLGSVCGLLVALAEVLLLVVRIFGEEKLLARDLEGYQAYRQKVRYRLMPHVW